MRAYFGMVILIGSFGLSCNRAVDWPESSPSEAGMDPARLSLLDSHIRGHLPHVRGVLVARRGRLIFEKYYGDASREALHNIQSMTKSITSALVGIALREGSITSLDNKALDYFPEYQGIITDERFRNITIRHLLRMSSGIETVRGSFDKILPHPAPDILRRRLVYDPGSGFTYSDLDAHLLGAVLGKATRLPVLDFAERKLFGPLGVRRFVWYGDNTGIRSGGFSGLWRARDVL